jgi:transcriptional regulator
MLILRVLRAGPAHGLFIAQAIERRSDDVLLVEQGSLYPALHRLEERKWIAADWGVSDTNRRARFYRLTPAGKRQLAAEENRWASIVHAIGRVMRPETE